MRIGLLSDSHGRDATTRRGVEILIARGAELLLHLGDVGSELVIDALATSVPARLVFGNTDGDLHSLTSHAKRLGVLVDHPVGRLALERGELVFLHGDDHRAMAEAVARKVRYLCHGHTHEATDRRFGPTRIINPGALFRAAEYSVALLDTSADGLTFYAVPGPC